MSAITILFLVACIVLATLVGGLIPLLGHAAAAVIVFVALQALVAAAIERRAAYRHRLAADPRVGDGERAALQQEIELSKGRAEGAATAATLAAFVAAGVTFVHPWLGLLALVCGGFSYFLGFAKR